MKTLFIVTVLLMMSVPIVTRSQSDTLLIQLNHALESKLDYESVKLQRLRDLHARLNKTRLPDNEQYLILQKLSYEYETFIYDSAFSYNQRLKQVAHALQDPVKIAHSKIRLGFILLSAGMFKETLDSLVNLRVHEMPDTIKTDYYSILARAYYDLGDFDKDKFYTPYYNLLGSKYIDSAKNLCASDSYQYIYLSGLQDLKNGNTKKAEAQLSTLLTSYELTSHQLAVTGSTLSFLYVSRNKSAEAISLLAQAAIADIQSSTKETSALSTLAELLYKNGDVKQAYIYIQQAMEDAIFYGARQRKAQVGSILPLIASAKVNNVDEQRKIWLLYSALITGLVILVLVFAIIISRQLKKRKIAEKALQEANKIKDEYIGYYFNINSEFLGKIEAFKKSIEMKLMTKKTDDIRFIVNSINLKKEREELYHSFDKVFLKLFPDFVTSFNSFFKEEDKIVLKEGQLLNTELRIFALIRMGIHDTEKIARILDYSINTIYNYKARVKSKSSVPNDQFEKRIMEIHAI
jgi:DNA-binding CsgD family transcriptional regulator